MIASLLHQVFGFGKIPKPMMPTLQQEGVVLLEEGIGGSVTFRNFRAPWKRYSYRRNGFVGSLVLTQMRFAAFQFSKPLINVPLEREAIEKLDLSLEGEDKLRVGFEAGDFHQNWSGTIECRFSTPRARLFLDRLSGTKMP